MNKNTQWIHIKAFFESENNQLAEELVSDIFFSLGIKGVVCEVVLPEPAEGYASDALPLPDTNSVSGYLPDTDSSVPRLDAIKKKAADLAEVDIRVTIETKSVDQEDWAESWKEFFFVTRITDTIVVKPEWREYSPLPHDIVIEIDPGMAFGTGTHPTTSMCITMIERHLTPGMSFLDVGTGSGILMVAASGLGAGHIAGIDTDEIAVNTARENLEKNGIPSPGFHIEQNTLEGFQKKNAEGFDLIAANIIAEVISEIIPHLRKSLSQGGKVILSGIITDKKDTILEELTKSGFTPIEIITQGEWIGITATSLSGD